MESTEAVFTPCYIMRRVDILGENGKDIKENFWLGKVHILINLKLF
jgi:hypothetical protein